MMLVLRKFFGKIGGAISHKSRQGTIAHLPKPRADCCPARQDGHRERPFPDLFLSFG
jgi:hypothetical protein